MVLEAVFIPLQPALECVTRWIDRSLDNQANDVPKQDGVDSRKILGLSVLRWAVSHACVRPRTLTACPRIGNSAHRPPTQRRGTSQFPGQIVKRSFFDISARCLRSVLLDERLLNK